MLLGSRYIYELYYEKEAISRQLYEWLLKNGYADANLIAKWKKQGYEKVFYSIFSSLDVFVYHYHMVVVAVPWTTFPELPTYIPLSTQSSSFGADFFSPLLT